MGSSLHLTIPMEGTAAALLSHLQALNSKKLLGAFSGPSSFQAKKKSIISILIENKPPSSLQASKPLLLGADLSTVPTSCHRSLSPKPSAIIFSSYSSRSPSIWAEVSCTSYRTAQKLSNGGPHLSHDKIQNLLGTQKPKQIAFIWGKNLFLRSRSEKTMSELAKQSQTSSGASAADDSWVPKLDMEFESDKKACQFYCSYAREIGFGVRKNVVKRTTKEGKMPRPDARTGCGARIIVRLLDNGKFHVMEFEAEHNH